MKALFVIAAATTVAVLAFAGIASAHTASVVPSCTGLAVNLVAYEGSSPNNRVTTTIDGIPTVVNFGGSYVHTFTWSQTAAHAWSVVIDANRQTGNATQYDRTFSGTQQACQVAVTTTQPAVTTTQLATTTTQLATTTSVAAPTTTQLATTDPTLTLDTVPVNTIVFDIGTPLVPQCPYNPVLTIDSPQCVVILPQTGRDATLTWVAAALLVAGLGGVLAARRRAT